MKYYKDDFFKELIVDNFAGGGGASIGIELATGRPVDIAVNHDADAIAMHSVNHPCTQHYREDVFAIDPEKVTDGRPVGIAWFSPDCKHFSKAKGGAPVEKKIRGLSWVILRWAMSKVSPRCIFMENVEEIRTWGPLIEADGKMRPDPARRGETFNGFMAMLTTGISKDHPAFAEACEFLKISPDSEQAERLSKGLGYEAEWKVLRACDYGAPTIRKRFYMVARRDGKPIAFPKPTHGKGKKPYRTAAECIDWSIPCPSIFGRKKELAENTKRRIARGLDKFVIKNPQPFIMQMNFENPPQDINKPLSTHTAVNKHYMVTPSIVPVGYGERKGQSPRVHDISDPLSTVVSSCKQNLELPKLSPYIMSNNTNNAPHSINDPVPTQTTGIRNFCCAANIVHYYGGADHASKADGPLPTVTTLPRHYLTESRLCVLRNNTDCKPLTEPSPTVTAHAQMAQIVTYVQKLDGAQDLKNWHKVRKLLNEYAGYSIAEDEILIIEIDGVQHFVSDIGMRMLKAEELKLAQGFPEDYVIDVEPYIGKKYSEAKQIARLGNAVCPPVATALIRANCADMAYRKRLKTVAELNRAMSA